MSVAEPPVLSVIIPVWNGARYLAEAIESVLTQEGPSLEVIVVDDGSDDDSASVAERFGDPVRCLRRPHAGLAFARNAGLDAARGSLLLHLDADDILPPNSIAARMTVLNASPDTDLVVGFMQSFVSPDVDPQTRARFGPMPGPQRGGLPGTSIVRAAFADRVGRFDSTLGQSPDLEWMMRAQGLTMNLVTIPDVVLRRRIHGGNMSLKSGSAAVRLRLLRATLGRRREGGKSDAP